MKSLSTLRSKDGKVGFERLEKKGRSKPENNAGGSRGAGKSSLFSKRGETTRGEGIPRILAGECSREHEEGKTDFLKKKKEGTANKIVKGGRVAGEKVKPTRGRSFLAKERLHEKKGIRRTSRS